VSLKVIIVGPSLSKLGGISTFCGGLINALKKKEIKAFYFDTYKAKKRVEQKNSVLNKYELFGGFKVVFSFYKFLKEKYADNIIINTSSYWGFYEKSLLLVVSKLLSKNTTLIVHGADFLIFYQKSYCRHLIKYFLNKPDQTIFVSEEHQKYFKKECKNEKFIHLDVPVEVSQNIELSQYVEYDKYIAEFNKYKTIFLSVSILEARKNIIEVIDGFAKGSNTDSCLIIAGSGPLEDVILKACSKYSNVFFVGPAIGKFKLFLYQYSDFFICNSARESFGITFIEAMYQYCLVISPKTGVLHNFNSNDEYICVDEPIDLAFKRALKLTELEVKNMNIKANTKAHDYSWDNKIQYFIDSFGYFK